jgi:hypothetical protein
MIEARIFVTDLAPYRAILLAHDVVLKGEYKIHNYIYASTNPTKTLSDEFLRLRLIPQNIWKDKAVVVAIKNTEVKEVGKNSVIPLKMQFDTEAEGRKYIEENLLDKFVYDFEFGCIGWQYDLGEDQVDLEDIQGHYSIEVKSKKEEGVKRLLGMLGIQDIITGPSVVAMKKLLKL